MSIAEQDKLGTHYNLVEQSLFDLAAMLIKYEVVSLEELWPHIEPKRDADAVNSTHDEINSLRAL